ncbi:ParB/RepB/Spo0J family partition protein [Pectinatus sottacetonis]|uniref:ParB/RepB/Spo0J family partition protein n=1 Tax=Pectinatus sottacetonis TaxID=1002795 RepID=UPI0018C4ADEF|nr:ParB/RepB/Spo0J family partition protein [Pectinatus sottacetonis]
MTKKTTHNALGRGLGALLKDAESDKGKIEQINTVDILSNPFQPRHNFDDTNIDELAQSIKKYGILQPVLVRMVDGKYQLIAGERRLRACKRINMQAIPAIVCDYNDKETAQIALIENLQREDLNAIEEAAAYQKLITEIGLTQSDVAQYVGKSRSHIANFLRLLKLSETVKKYVVDDVLNMGQAKPLLSIDDIQLQEQTALYIIANELSARDAENLVKKVLQNPQYFTMGKKETEKTKDVFINDAEDKLKLLLGTKVKIKKGLKKSKIEIEFTSEQELDRIVETLIKEKTTNKTQKMEKEFFV